MKQATALLTDCLPEQEQVNLARFLYRLDIAQLDSAEAGYAALLEGMDKSLGDILDYLDRQHLSENTVVLFMSDNGGSSTSPARSGRAHTQNLPLRAGKSSVYEGGIREPMLVRWPGVVKPGSVANQYVIIESVFVKMAFATNAMQRTLDNLQDSSHLPEGNVYSRRLATVCRADVSIRPLM